MPEIEIRPPNSADIPKLVELDHDYVSDHVWQMEVQHETGQKPSDLRVEIVFRQLKLPRSVHVEYPRSPTGLMDDWKERSCLLVAALQGEVVGYASVMLNISPYTGWLTDLAVMRRLRRQGIGSTLVLAGQEWARQKRCSRMVLEMQPKNYPAICLAQKLGYDLCGYNDHYFPNHDIALFFSKSLR
ncbi:MAG TPA: GNAT family N-acetyltransferase [Anaerolineales bacterium]|nr:GNAT family N-acetyltransferase [Anaerolineales bacterium]